MNTNAKRPLSETNSVPSHDLESKEQQLRDRIAKDHDMSLETYRQAVTQFTEEIPWMKGDNLEQVMGKGICDWLGWKY